jgi:PAS domain S-box-containing protein
MISKQKVMLIVTVLFIIAGAGLYVLIRYAATHPDSPQPYPLFSLLAITLLFIGTVVLFNNIIEYQKQLIRNLQEKLDRANQELETTKVSHEERVERRTFEISVANAALNREIAERIQTEAEMKRIKHQMELILESAGEGIFGLDANGKMTFVNKAASLMLGWEPHELIEKSHHEMVHHTRANGEHCPVQECPISLAFQDGIVHFGSEEVFWAKDGSSFQVEYVSTPIMENGTLTGAVVLFRDISTRN